MITATVATVMKESLQRARKKRLSFLSSFLGAVTVVLFAVVLLTVMFGWMLGVFAGLAGAVGVWFYGRYVFSWLSSYNAFVTDVAERAVFISSSDSAHLLWEFPEAIFTAERFYSV